MSVDFDIAVVGAGPAGAHAAMSAQNCGCSVVLLDEAEQPGGQVWRAKSKSILNAPDTPETRAGDALRSAIKHSKLVHFGKTRVWQIERMDNDWQLHLMQNGQARVLTARALILATGAREFVQPVPGWTLPGVFGLAGATALFKEALTVPGNNTVVSGTGPLVFFVASEIRRLGGHVLAVVTPNSRMDWLRALPAMSLRPDLLVRGAVWIADLLAAGVPIRWRHAVTGISGTGKVETVNFQKVAADWSPHGPAITMHADSLCLGNGLEPETQAAQLAGLALSFQPDLGGWVPGASTNGSTDVKSLYVCGDGAGIAGVDAAVVQGQLAGLKASMDLGAPAEEKRLEQLASEYIRAARFGRAATALSLRRTGLAQLATPDTILCRCESLTVADIQNETDSGAASPSAVKSGLRAGMGPCGGRYCLGAVARLIEASTGSPEGSAGPPTPRPPLRPVPLATVAGDFSYDDLPISKPAPL